MTRTSITLSDDMTAPATRAVFAALEAFFSKKYGGGKGCVRFVGGCVRNLLMGAEISDLDLSTQLTPDETEAALAEAGIKSVPTGKAFGTITAVIERNPYEITSLREDVETDGRRAVVKYTTDWAKDAQRRDFYINALYADIDGLVYDPTGFGLADAEAGRVRFIGDAEQRIREDYLRILRFFRFSAGYARAFDIPSLEACNQLKGGIESLSGERLQQELMKILALAEPLKAFEAMQTAGVMPLLLPGWHGGDFTQVANMVRFTADQERRLLAVFDSGVGLTAEALRRAQDRLKFSRALFDRLYGAGVAASRLADADPSSLKRLIYAMGREAVSDAILLIAAHLGRSPDSMMAQLKTFDVPVFPIKGADLIARGMEPGPEVGIRLKQIETEWIHHDFSQSVIDEALDALAK